MTPPSLEAWISRKIGCAPFNRPALEAYQLAHINATLARLVEKSLFYRRLLADRPHRLSSLDQIAMLPFTTAEDLRQSGPGMLCVSQSEIERIVTLDTSGTTGQPKRLYFTQADQELTIDFFHHGMATFTQPGDKVVILLPYQTPGSVGDLLITGLQRLGAQSIPIGPQFDPQQTLNIIDAQQATGLVGSPIQALALARWFTHRPGRQLAPSAQAWRLKNVLLSTDHASAAIQSALQDAWGCQVFDHYGITETGLGCGLACTAHTGYHLREADLYVEVIDPHTGQPAPTGQPGEVVFTTLTRTGMPLLRYRTGDLSRFIPRACPCGADLKTLAPIQERLAARVEIIPGDPASSLNMPALDAVLFTWPQILNFTATLTGSFQRSQLTLRAVALPGSGFGPSEPAVLAALQAIPVIQAAVAAHILEVQLQFQEFSSMGSLAKRQVVDLRS